METRQLWILNVALALCALALAWRLDAQWQNGQQRSARRAPGEVAALFVPPAPQQAEIVNTDQVVAKNVFMPDRSSTRTDTQATPPPQLPVVFGTMNLGGSYEALMAEAGQGDSRRAHRVKSGETFGGYIVSEITDETVVVELGGQKTPINVYQSANSATRNTAPALAAPTVAAGPAVETTTSAVPPTPANTFPAGSSAPPASTAANTPLPPDVRMTIEGNRKRYERTTPFGPQVWYEEIPK